MRFKAWVFFAYEHRELGALIHTHTLVVCNGADRSLSSRTCAMCAGRLSVCM